MLHKIQATLPLPVRHFCPCMTHLIWYLKGKVLRENQRLQWIESFTVILFIAKFQLENLLSEPTYRFASRRCHQSYVEHDYILYIIM